MLLAVVVGDRLIFINETPVHSALEVREILREHVPGENITATVLKTNGNEQTFDITLYNFPEASRTVYFVVPSILSAVFLVVSLWIFGFRRNESAGRAFSLFTSSLAIVTGAYFNLITTHEFTIAWTFATGIAGGALINHILP